jgi:hypothetical protein
MILQQLRNNMKHIKKFESYSLNEWFFNRKPQSEIEEEKKNILQSMREFIKINFYMDAEKLTDEQVLDKMKWAAHWGKNKFASQGNKQALELYKIAKTLFK